MYDVIVVGARVAGASTALHLARRGLKVLAVDRAEFPSDTLSTQLPYPPAVTQVHFHPDGPTARIVSHYAPRPAASGS